MKRIIIILAVTLCATGAGAQRAKEEIKPYVGFLEERKHTSAKEYVVSLFEKHDLVILCERDHRDVKQYEMILDVIADPYFTENVGAVFTEIGARGLDAELNEFLSDAALSDRQVEEKAVGFQRRLMDPLWDKTNYIHLMKGIHSINRGLPTGKKVKLHPTGGLSIEGEPTAEKYDRMMVNYIRTDFDMANHIRETFDAMKEKNPAAKALVIMNFRHAFNFGFDELGGLNAGNLLYNLYPRRTAHVMINGYRSWDFGAVQDGRWDAAFKVAGVEDAGFDLAGTPFGECDFDYVNEKYREGRTYKDVFTGFVFYRPFAKFETWIGWEGLVDDATAKRSILCGRLLTEAMARFSARPYPERPEPTVEQYKEACNSLHKGGLWNQAQLDEAINKWIE
jgi:hypothetical protein